MEGDYIKEILIHTKKTILNAISNYQARGSGWHFDEVLKLEINTVKYQPIKGSSYIKLPDEIAAKKAIINVHVVNFKIFTPQRNKKMHKD